MKDFQRGWYMQLMLLCAVSQRPGYIASTERLWELAGAHRRDFWDLHKSAVMACFKTRTIDGTEWIYNERLLHTIEHQHRKLSKSLELHNTHKNVSVSKVSLKPSLEEVKNYCKERNNQINADEWYSHYEANGWRVGRVAMKDWKAAVRTWEARNYGADRKHYQAQPEQPSEEPTKPDLYEQADPECEDCAGIGYTGKSGELVPCHCTGTVAKRSD